MFRGFRATAGSRGRTEYAFQWLFRRTMHARYDARTHALTFPALFPAIDPDTNIAPLLKSLVGERLRGGRLPKHKQLDQRRARLSATLRGRDLTLAVSARGNNHDYAVRFALNLINDLFVELQTYFPEYLVEEFGMSTE